MNNAAIYYEAECYDTHQEQLMGRNSAGEGFLRGFAKHSGVDKFYCHIGDMMEFGKQLTELIGEDSIQIEDIPVGQVVRLAEVGCLYVPDPRLSEHAWRRWRIGTTKYSLCGVTHTTCSTEAMDSVIASMMAPTTPWDAIVCPSKCVKDTVDELYRAQSAYIDKRFLLCGALKESRDVRPQTPIIPFGVDCSLYAHNEEHRKVWRERLNIGDEDFAFLNFGRQSYHAKANPLPMFDALEQVAKQTDTKIHLILAGWFASQHIANDFQYAALELCPSVNIRVVDGRASDSRYEIWSAADAFISLSDNYQETFGLVLLEAMAAGLPVIASNWSGYKEIVVDGATGFLVKTLAGIGDYGRLLIQRYTNGEIDYDHYIGYLSQFVGVSISETMLRCLDLVKDRRLCKQLGECGRLRAEQWYDWEHVIKQYQELWKELTERRFAACSSKGERPARLNPEWLFNSYSSDKLDEVRVAPNALEIVEKRRKLGIVSFAESELPSQETVTDFLECLQKKGLEYAMIHMDVRPIDINWLYKVGAIELK